jgi:hypothetical protein
MTDEIGPRYSDLSVWFDFMTKEHYIPPVQHYTEILLNRLIPIFDDLDGEQQRAAHAVYHQPHWRDEDEAIQAAYDYSFQQVTQFMELRSVFLATGVAGLFHLFEKQLYRHLNSELKYLLTSQVKAWKDATHIIQLLDRPATADGHTALWAAFNDPDLKELRLVANAVKHGEGLAYNELKTMGAVVVDATRIETDLAVGPFSVLAVSLVIQPEDVRRYEAAILRFWALKGVFWRKLDDPSPGRP